MPHVRLMERIQSYCAIYDLRNASFRIINDGSASNCRMDIDDDHKRAFACIRSWVYFTIYDTVKHDPNTEPCITAQYDYMQWRWPYVSVNDHACLTWAGGGTTLAIRPWPLGLTWSESMPRFPRLETRRMLVRERQSWRSYHVYTDSTYQSRSRGLLHLKRIDSCSERDTVRTIIPWPETLDGFQ